MCTSPPWNCEALSLVNLIRSPPRTWKGTENSCSSTYAFLILYFEQSHGWFHGSGHNLCIRKSDDIRHLFGSLPFGFRSSLGTTPYKEAVSITEQILTNSPWKTDSSWLTVKGALSPCQLIHEPRQQVFSKRLLKASNLEHLKRGACPDAWPGTVHHAPQGWWSCPSLQSLEVASGDQWQITLVPRRHPHHWSSARYKEAIVNEHSSPICGFDSKVL